MKKQPFLCLSLLTLFVLAACGDSKADPAALKAELKTARAEARKLIKEHELLDDPEIEALDQAASEASRAFVKARKEHPALKEFYETSDELTSAMVKAKTDGNDALFNELKSKYATARGNLETAASKFPELVEIQRAAITANEEAQKAKKDALGSLPEGKTLLDTIEKIEAKLTDLRKQK